MLDTMTREYLTDIKFRNAVKRSVSGRLIGKNDYGTGVVVRGADTRDDDPTLFKVTYNWGTYGVHSLEKQLNLERELVLAGFELVKVEVWDWFKKWHEDYVWRKEA